MIGMLPMPWLQEASLNIKYIFDYFNQRGNKTIPKFQDGLSQKIHDRGWTSDGMFILQIHYVFRSIVKIHR